MKISVLNKIMKNQFKNIIPFVLIGILFTISCILGEHAYQIGSESGQYLSWCITVVPVVAGLIYLKIRNK